MKPSASNQSPKDTTQQRMERLRISEADFEEQFSRSSGPGGQHVNKVSTAVTLRHKPTNIVVTVQDSRSQAINRQLARERLLDTIESGIKARRDERRAASEKIRRQNRKRPRGLKNWILDGKKRRGSVKKLRSKIDE